MDKIYHWIGFIVTWAAAAFVVLCILLYLYCNDYFKFSIGKNSIFYKQWNLVWNPDFGKYDIRKPETIPHRESWKIEKLPFGLYLMWLSGDPITSVTIQQNEENGH